MTSSRRLQSVRPTASTSGEHPLGSGARGAALEKGFLGGDTWDSASLSAFFTNVAHELRSPLGVVTVSLRQLKADFDERSTGDQAQLFALAERGTARFARIADSLSLLGALESGRFAPFLRGVDLVDVVSAAVAKAIRLEPRRDVEIKCELPAYCIPVDADALRLGQVIGEIVINGIRHAHETVLIQVVLAEGEARVVVDDDGQGFDELTRRNLFRRFVARGPDAGLGVGLSIARDVIVAHGGTIRLERSKLDPGVPGTVGASLLVSLPLRVAP